MITQISLWALESQPDAPIIARFERCDNLRMEGYSARYHYPTIELAELLADRVRAQSQCWRVHPFTGGGIGWTATRVVHP